MKRLLFAFVAGALAEWCWLAYSGHLDRPWPVDKTEQA